MDRPLRRTDLAAEPLEQFRRWWEERASAGSEARDAVALATVDAEGNPSLRMVLLRGFGSDGFRFYTNRESRKGRALEATGRAALLVYDEAHERQIRLEGTVRRLDDAASDAYWAGRPRASQLSAYVSRQSEPVPDRATLERAWAEAEARLRDRPVPRPPHWGGYALDPRCYEFWQNREARLHDRFVYTREGSGWRVERLWP